MAGRRLLKQPEAWLFGGGAMVVALLLGTTAPSNPPISTLFWWRALLGGSLFAMVVSGAEMVRGPAWKAALWFVGREPEEKYLRPQAIAFAREMRRYYDRFKDDPQMPRQFFARFYDGIYYYQGRLAAAGMKIDPWIIQREYIEGWMNETMVDVIIFSVECAASKVPEDIPS